MTYLDRELPLTPRDRLNRAEDDPAVVARPGDVVELLCPWEGSQVPTGDCYLIAGRLLAWGQWARNHRGWLTEQPMTTPSHDFGWARLEVPGATGDLCGWVRVESPGIVKVEHGGFVVGLYDRMPDWPIRRRHSYWCEPFLSWDGA